MFGAFNIPAASFRSRAIVLVLILALLASSGVYFIGSKFKELKAEASFAVANGWRAFTPDALNAELANGRAVFIDFTAAWCITCKFNESTVLESGAVREAFERRGVVKFKRS